MIKNIEIGKRVRQIRLAYGFSQNEFATEIGKTRGYIALMEKGNIYSDRVLSEIAHRFDINENWLRAGVGTAPEPIEVEIAEGIGERIRAIHESIALSQAKFADLLQYSQPVIARIECEYRKPSMKFLHLISAQMNVPLSYLTKGMPLPENWIPPMEFIDADVARIILYLISHNEMISEIQNQIQKEENKTETIVGANIRHLREERKWSRETLGAKVGCSYSMIKSYEYEELLPPLKILSSLAEVFGVNIEFLLTHVY